MPEAPVDAFLRFTCSDGLLDKALKGESLDPQFLGTFHITSFSFSLGGAGKGGASQSGAQGKAAAGQSGSHRTQPGGSQHSNAGGQSKDSSQETFPGFDMEMPMQIGSPILMNLCAKFANAQTDEEKEKLEIKSAELFVRRSGMPDYAAQKSGQDWFLKITLEKVTVGSYRTSIECHDTFTLHYETMTVEYWRSDPNTGRVLTKAPDEDPDSRYVSSGQWSSEKKGGWQSD